MKVQTKIFVYIFLAISTMLLGLLSRSGLKNIPEFLALYSGDVLWALLVFWLVCVVRPNWSTKALTASALMFSYSIELSQLYHAPWIDNLRSYKIGGLVLGFGFKWSDIFLYTIGILFGAAISKLIASVFK